MTMQDKSLGTRKLNSGILGASVANLSVTGLKDNVVISLRNTEPIPVSRVIHKWEKQLDVQLYIVNWLKVILCFTNLQANFVATCVFWDFTLHSKFSVTVSSWLSEYKQMLK